MLKKLDSAFIFWFLFVLSFLIIITVKFSPLTEMHSSEIRLISWFHYGFELGEILVNLSAGYIISCVFYWIVVYFPDRKKRRSAMTIIQRKIDHISEMMTVTLNYFFHTLGIPDLTDENNIQQEFNKIQTLNNINQTNFYYQYYEKATGRTVKCNTGDYTELKLLLHQYAVTQQTVDDIFRVPSITIVDHELIEIIEKTRNCLLFKDVFYINCLGQVQTPELGKHLFEYFLLHKSLAKYVVSTKFTFTQEPVDCWYDLDITEGKRQYRTNHS